MSGIQQLLLGGSPAGGYQIERSLRFNSADSANLSRTFGAPTDSKKYTFSIWFKRGPGLGNLQYLLTNTAQTGLLWFSTDNTLRFVEAGSTSNVTNAVFRDPSAWYHIVFSVDTSNATAADRLILYINSVRQTLSTTSNPTLNNNTAINANGSAGRIGQDGASGSFLNGYMTEVNFIDGQALTPSSFGQNNAQTGVWEPVKYTGTYGTNGFYLNFSDNSNTTAATLGKDSSGNGNNWTPSGFSVTAGAGNDSLVDTPTSYGTDTGVGGEVRGNYCTLNPLDRTDSNTSVTNGNLTAQGYLYGGSDYRSVKGTMYQTEKFYFEATISNTGSSADWYGQIGIANSSFTCPLGTRVGGNANSWAFIIRGGSGDVAKLNNNSATQLAASLPSAGDVIMVACDPANGKVWFGRNGTWYGSGDPAAGTNAAYTNVSSSVTPAAGMYYNLDIWNTNFGQRPFAYTAPSGFKALCTQNLPTPTIGATSTTQAGNYFNANLYTGTGSAFTLTGVGFQPDFGWFKGRNASSSHWFHDVVRGANPGLSSNNTLAEDTTAGQLTAFASDGYSLPNDSAGYLNFNGRTMVVWSWKGGGTGVTNTDGTITSTVSANTTAGFSIVTYTGNGTSGATVGHGLGVAPSMIILKDRDSNSVQNNWLVWHTSLSSNNNLYLSTTDAQASYTSTSYGGIGTSPTSTTFLLGSGTVSNITPNENGDKYVAYCFAAIAGYSAFGSYSGNNSSTDGTFVYLGFRPRFIMIKSTSASTEWVMVDSARSTYNLVDTSLYANRAYSEATIGTVDDIDFLSNGFKLRNNTGFVNASQTYIYAAFAESPFKYSLAR